MRPTALLAITALCACAPSVPPESPPAEVTLAAEQPTFSPGDSVTLVLTNRSSAEIGYNLCTAAMERQESDSWLPVPSDRVCTMELRSLPPGDQVRYPIEVPDDLRPGTYRFVTTAEGMASGERSPLRSELVRVVP